MHTALCLPYLMKYATDEQKKRWLPPFVSGEMMTAIAMTEPGTGSDLAGMKTTAEAVRGRQPLRPQRRQDLHHRRRARRPRPGLLPHRPAHPAGPARRHHHPGGRHRQSEGYAVGRTLDKLGLKTSDTAELSFTDVRVPVEDRLGEEGEAFGYLAHNLPQERLGIAVGGYAQADAAVRFALDYVRERTVFGRSVAEFQNTKFVLADCRAEVDAAQAVVDRALDAHDAGELTAADAASAKLFCTEVAARVIDKCLQLHGGYGYMTEYPIARLYADTRVTRIYGGTSEVMRSIIAKSMGL